MPRLTGVCVVTAASAAWAGVAAQVGVGAAVYSIQAVPTLGGPSNAAYAINDAGLVVGQSSLDADPGGDRRAFIWDPASGTLTAISTFGGSGSSAYAIDALGRVTGRADTAGGIQHAFLWDAGVLTDLSAGSPTQFASGWDLDAHAGMVVGHVGAFARIWTSSGEINPGALGTPTRAYGVNSFGEVVGESGLRAFYYFDDGDPATSDMRDLGTLPGGMPRARAHDINDAHQVVGEAHIGTSDLEDFHAVLWQQLAWDPNGRYAGQIIDLGVLSGGSRSYARAINPAGIVVGYAASVGIGVPHAFVWDAGRGMRDLNDLIDPAAGWELRFALDINAAGQIVGYGTAPDGQTRGFLLTPVSCPADLDGDGQVGLSDLSILLNNFGTTGASPADGDLDGDGDVDLVDLSALLAVFGTSCA